MRVAEGSSWFGESTVVKPAREPVGVALGRPDGGFEDEDERVSLRLFRRCETAATGASSSSALMIHELALDARRGVWRARVGRDDGCDEGYQDCSKAFLDFWLDAPTDCCTHLRDEERHLHSDATAPDFTLEWSRRTVDAARLEMRRWLVGSF